MSIRSNGFISTISLAYRNIIIPKIFALIVSILNAIVSENSDILLFGSGGGTAYGAGNSKFVFEWIHENRDDLNPVWLTRSSSVYSHLKERGLPVAKIHSLKGMYLLAQAKIGLVSNNLGDISVDSNLIRDSMSIIYLDHGRPVKFGKKHWPESRRRRFVNQFDYWIFRSRFHAKSAAFHPQIDPEYLITGYPRNDILVEPNDNLSPLKNVDDANSVVLYAPTKRLHSRWDNPVKLFPFDDFNVNKLAEFLEDNDIILLISLHPSTMSDLTSPELVNWVKPLKDRLDRLLKSSGQIRLISDDTFVSTNEYLIDVDILMTDYSSLYHDYLIQDRPIIFIPYDYDEFDKKIGFKYDYFSNLPGPAINSYEQFVNYVDQLLKEKDPHSEERHQLRDKIHPHPDGNYTKRVVRAIDAIRNGQPVDSVKEVELYKTDSGDSK